MYMLMLLDTYAPTYAVLVMALCECIAVAWIYGLSVAPSLCLCHSLDPRVAARRIQRLVVRNGAEEARRTESRGANGRGGNVLLARGSGLLCQNNLSIPLVF